MLEIACFNALSALNAFMAGADRIELCDGPSVGGTTPDPRTAEMVKSKVLIPINVMIRPRGGDFKYSDEEFRQMKADMESLRPYADGFVLGILDAENQVDIQRNRDLVRLAAPRPCTFHRAFDDAADLSKAIEHVIACGFASILTSGGLPSAVSGSDSLGKLVSIADGRISIIVGGGVRSSNVAMLKTNTKAEWYHSSAIIDDSGVSSTKEISNMTRLLKET